MKLIGTAVTKDDLGKPIGGEEVTLTLTAHELFQLVDAMEDYAMKSGTFDLMKKRMAIATSIEEVERQAIAVLKGD